MIQHGRDVVIFYNGGTSLALAKDVTVTFDRNLIETNSPDSMFNSDYVAGREKWSINCSGLVAVDDITFEELTSSREKIPVSLNIGQFMYSGNVLAKSCNVSGRIGSLVSYNLQLQGCGPITITARPSS